MSPGTLASVIVVVVVVAGIDVHLGGAIFEIVHRHLPRAAAHLTIFDILLMRAGTGVERDFDRLPAVGTKHLAREVGSTIAERKLVVEQGIIVFIGQVPRVAVGHIVS